MYCPPIGDPSRCIGHEGQLYEIGPAHRPEYPDAAKLPHTSEHYCVYALSRNGTDAWTRRVVYTNDVDGILAICDGKDPSGLSDETVFNRDRNKDDPWLPGDHNEAGSIFGCALLSRPARQLRATTRPAHAHPHV